MSARRLCATMAGRSAATRLSPRALASVLSSASAGWSTESHVPLRRVGLPYGLGLRTPPGVPVSARRVERVRPPAAAAVGDSQVGSARRGTLKRPDSAEGDRVAACSRGVGRAHPGQQSVCMQATRMCREQWSACSRACSPPPSLDSATDAHLGWRRGSAAGWRAVGTAVGPQSIVGGDQ